MTLTTQTQLIHVGMLQETPGLPKESLGSVYRIDIPTDTTLTQLEECVSELLQRHGAHDHHRTYPYLHRGYAYVYVYA